MVTGAMAAAMGLVLFAGGLAVGHATIAPDAIQPGTTASTATDGSTASQELDLINEAWKTIQDHYVDAAHLDDQAMAYAAIEGLTKAVGDEGHTTFLTAAESKAMDQSLSGTFVGIGIQVSADTSNGPVVNNVIPNTPAEEAGLQRGDRITAVDGTTTEGETIDQTIGRIRGPEGESVTLTIDRTGTKPFDVTIVRRKFDLPLVEWSMIPGQKTALIRLDQFATGATKGVQDALQAAKAEGANAVILDLRGNPGGYVNEAVGVASQFVGDGTVYRSVDASGVEKEVPVEPGGLWTTGPLVVLADGNTASSAEIVTGAIQDAGRGTVVGEKTFGTGTVLGRFDLADGSSLRIGVERWLTRDGRPIWHEGLEPDIKVALPADASILFPGDVQSMTASELASTSDTQLVKALAVIRGDG
jgi:carboxyl-terminal processing protease